MYNYIYLCSFSGAEYAFLASGDIGGWVIRVKGQLSPRPDNSRVNTSPVAVFSPDLTILEGCNSTLVIPGNNIRYL